MCSQYEFTVYARTYVLNVMAWSNAWYMALFHPPNLSSDRWARLEAISYRYLFTGTIAGYTTTDTAAHVTDKMRWLLSKADCAAHHHDGGLGFPQPTLTARAVQATILLALLYPTRENVGAPATTGALWTAIPMGWLLHDARMTRVCCNMFAIA